MSIAIVTSSRADFGFLRPLIGEMKKQGVSFQLIVTGSHLSHFYGHTVDEISSENIPISEKVEVMLASDTAESVSCSMGLTTLKFSNIWARMAKDIELILCLGDRFELFAAVSAALPFNISIAHISGGEETLGAIDNVFRHSLTQMAKYHFTNTKANAAKVIELKGQSSNVFHTGSLAIDNIKTTKLFSLKEFHERYNVDLKVDTLLVTYHPETVSNESTLGNVNELIKGLASTHYQLLITMPNADTSSSIIRSALSKFSTQNKLVFLVEHLGSRGYYTAMKYCKMIVGNSSSGIVEAASFNKFVINIGERQKGRECSENIIHTAVNATSISKAIEDLRLSPPRIMKNIYGDGNARFRMVDVLKQIGTKEVDG